MTIAGIALATLGPAVVACGITDDEPPAEGASDTEGIACFDNAQAAQANCELPLMFFANIDTDETIISIDDPGAGIQIGPNGWLLDGNASADWFAWGDFSQECGYACALCEPGSHVCYTEGPGGAPCFACIQGDGPVAESLAACGDFLDSCQSPGDSGLDTTGGGDDDGGLDTTGDGGDGGLDSTGAAEGNDQSPGVDGPDCGQWYDLLEEGVSVGLNDNIAVDAKIVETLMAHAGEQITGCDDTRLASADGGYLKVRRRTDKSLMARLGIVPGDVLYTIDGKKQNSTSAIMEALAPFLSGDAPSFLEITVLKEGKKDSPMRLQIKIH